MQSADKKNLQNLNVQSNQSGSNEFVKNSIDGIRISRLKTRLQTRSRLLLETENESHKNATNSKKGSSSKIDEKLPSDAHTKQSKPVTYFSLNPPKHDNKCIVTNIEIFPSKIITNDVDSVIILPPVQTNDNWIDKAKIVTQIILDSGGTNLPIVCLPSSEISQLMFYQVIYNNLSFEQILKKLNENKYKNGFRWQFDMRSIFANVFNAYEIHSPKWCTARDLCALFEEQCRDITCLNPYAIIDKSSNLAELNDSATLSSKSKRFADSKTFNVNTVVKKKVKKKLPKGVIVRDNGHYLYTTQCYGTPLDAYFTKNFPQSSLPEPQISLLPTGESKNILGLTNTQKKNIPARFKELDVTYRLALLKWLKDELGIHLELCALDVRYIPEFDLIPYVKAKNFISNMRSLLIQQKQAVEKYNLKPVLPFCLNLDLAYQEESLSPDQATSSVKEESNPKIELSSADFSSNASQITTTLKQTANLDQLAETKVNVAQTQAHLNANMVIYDTNENFSSDYSDGVEIYDFDYPVAISNTRFDPLRDAKSRLNSGNLDSNSENMLDQNGLGLWIHIK